MTTAPIRIPTMTAVCCREWPVAAFMPIGKCGLCDQRPTVIYKESIK